MLPLACMCMPEEQMLVGEHAHGRLKVRNIYCEYLVEVTERRKEKKKKGGKELMKK